VQCRTHSIDQNTTNTTDMSIHSRSNRF